MHPPSAAAAGRALRAPARLALLALALLLARAAAQPPAAAAPTPTPAAPRTLKLGCIAPLTGEKARRAAVRRERSVPGRARASAAGARSPRRRGAPAARPRPPRAPRVARTHLPPSPSPPSPRPQKNTGRAIKAAIEMAIAQVGPTRLPSYKISLSCEDTQCTDVGALYSARKLARAQVGAPARGGCVAGRARGRAPGAAGLSRGGRPTFRAPRSLPYAPAPHPPPSTRTHADAIVGDVCSAASLGALAVANKFQVRA